MIAAPGITWILDGLEVTMVGNVAAVLTDPKSGLGFTEGQVGLAGGIYIAGACTGALFSSYLTDKYGRKTLFFTLGIYLIFTVATAFSWNVWSFVFFRFMAGTGIGREYSAIYSAIDELIPARLRGQVALAISGSYWGGAGQSGRRRACERRLHTYVLRLEDRVWDRGAPELRRAPVYPDNQRTPKRVPR